MAQALKKLTDKIGFYFLEGTKFSMNLISLNIFLKSESTLKILS